MQLHKRKKNESRETDGEPIHLTPAAIERLHEQLVRLKRILPEAAAEAARTAEYGDRSDNAEYKQAKGSLRRMHYQIFEIENQLKHAVVIKVDPNESGTVQLGSTVVIEIEDDTAGDGKMRKTFQILGPHETDPTHGRISYLSPLGAALVGHKQGDIVIVKTGNTSRMYRISEIR